MWIGVTHTFDSSPIKGEGILSVGVVLFTRVALPLWIADQVRNDGFGRTPPCGYCLEASMTAARSVRPVVSRLRGNDGERGWE